MKKRFGMGIFFGSALLLLLTGCYTDEEKSLMREYKKQGEKNAVSYIEEKYGFEADVLEVECEKAGTMFDVSPPPTGDVFVKMKYEGERFYVSIAGDEESSDGFDNYQYDEIMSALKEEIDSVTGLESEELFVCFGEYDTLSTDEKNGMIEPYFDGENLTEVITEYATASVSYIESDVSEIDANAVSEMTGISQLMFIDYDSKKHYNTIKNPEYNISGTPIDTDIEDNMLYINGYLMLDYSGEAVYYGCDKTEFEDGMIIITRDDNSYVSVENTKLHPPYEWNGRGFIDADQVYDAYYLDTDSQMVYIYIPKENLKAGKKYLDSARIVTQYTYDGNEEAHYSAQVSEYTDDGEYLKCTLYTEKYDEIKFSVFVDRE